jgi:hypothetical protein
MVAGTAEHACLLPLGDSMRGPIRNTPLIWRLLAVATLTLTLGGCGASSAGQITTQPTATAVAPPLRGVKVPYLTGVSTVSADEGWAVGYDGLGGRRRVRAP